MYSGYMFDSKFEVPTPYLTHWVEVTPEEAKHILANYNTGNRRIKESKVAQLSRSVAMGDFLRTHQGIAFDEDGRLLDGQHRLGAIIRAGVPVTLMVTYGLPEVAQSEMDNGCKRTLAENLNFGYRMELDNQDTAILNCMIHKGYKLGFDSRIQAMDFFATYKVAIRFTRRLFRKAQKGFSAPMKAVLARAYYTIENKQKLERFVKVLYGCPTRPYESAALALASILNQSSRILESRELYCLTQRALYAFLRDLPLTRLRPLRSDAFPLPDYHDWIAEEVA